MNINKMFECVIDDEDAILDVIEGTQVFNHATREWQELPDGESDGDLFWKEVSSNPYDLIKYTRGAVDVFNGSDDDVLTVIRLPFMKDSALDISKITLIAGTDAPAGSKEVHWLD